MTRKLHFAELHCDSSVRYKYTLVGNYFLKCNKIKGIIGGNWGGGGGYGPLLRKPVLFFFFFFLFRQ